MEVYKWAISLSIIDNLKERKVRNLSVSAGHRLGVHLSGVRHISFHGWAFPGCGNLGLASLDTEVSPGTEVSQEWAFRAGKKTIIPMNTMKESDQFSVSVGPLSLLGRFYSPSCLDFPSSGGERAEIDRAARQTPGCFFCNIEVFIFLALLRLPN